MARRKKSEGGGGVPEWMCTFGDMMSLLLCFFIMLFAISTITDVKLEALIQTVATMQGYLGSSPTQSRDSKPSTSMSTTSELSRRTAALTGGQPTPGPAGDAASLQTIRIRGDRVKGGLIRFELGSDELNDQAKLDLERLLPVLALSMNKIMIKGHVAPTETENGQYKRDFYLAYARAVAVRTHLISLGLNKEFFQISVADSTSIPNRAILPQGTTDPKRAGTSAAVYLLHETTRTQNESI